MELLSDLYNHVPPDLLHSPVQRQITKRAYYIVSSESLLNHSGQGSLRSANKMSSGFVSGGTTDAPIQRSDEWLKAQLELEAERKAKADAAKAANEGRSLYETLEANKGS